ncbi:ras-like protein family member 12 isoform X4 [Mauremys reevesii]|uniref:ras-like protein family member 12 isoform X4 n=1 Tax=Mauremys reevesii TaxID=260615 RepID=UPI00193F1812|nr:ras-like protein family member 12 isoform X4 [Mauremys reevesii]
MSLLQRTGKEREGGGGGACLPSNVRPPHALWSRRGRGKRMSSMFGKPRATPSATDRHLPSLLPECNVAILGCRGSGKSALTVKFLTKRFISEYDPNLEDTYTSEETVDQQPVLMKVMDTADQDVPVNCERYLNWANAFMVVYSIDNKRSFEGCHQYLDTISLHAKGIRHDYPVLLLGNKLDLEQYRERRTFSCIVDVGLAARQTGHQSRRGVSSCQARVLVLRGLCLPGVRGCAACVP